MLKKKIWIVQDGTIVDPEIEKRFNDVLFNRDFKENKSGKTYNFVGYLYKGDELLVSFPKNTFQTDEISELFTNKLLFSKYLRLLYKCMFKTLSTIESKDNRYVDVKREFNSSYPFISFLNVYKYFQQYGLFTSQEEIKKFGYQGRILWKDTISKSPKIINNDNLLFFPLVVTEKKNSLVFISKCMAYVIDSTLEKFSLFLEGETTGLNTKDINFLANKEIVNKLRSLKGSMFKNIHIKLIDDLIEFFSFKQLKGGDRRLVINSFHYIWEEMVKELLINHFISVKNDLYLEFDLNEKRQNNFKKLRLYPDIRDIKGFYIEPDFYWESNDSKYIFDAKYYNEIENLDYKQISYYFMLKDFSVNSDCTRKQLKTYNRLILPTSKENYVYLHFQLKEEYNHNETRFNIVEQYLNVLTLMQIYTGYKINC